MRCSNCGVCCTETEMLLSEEDIQRLAKRGFSKSYFVKFDEQGYAQLKNRGGYCVFYDSKKHQCVVYLDRPMGCQVYPVILDEDKGIVLDNLCKCRETITQKEKKEKGKKVLKLLEIIDHEAANRRS